MGLDSKLISAIEKLGYENPTKIQKRVIPYLLKNKDLIAASKSGTGKTASFVLPMLQNINNQLNYENRVLRGLIIVPTRELVDQISVAMGEYGSDLKVRHTKIQGGVSKSQQIKKLESGIDILIATPGRLKDLMEDEIINLSSIKYIVLDETDVMLDMGFLKDIEFLLSHCSLSRQIVMCSATVSQNIKKLAKEFLNNPEVVEVSDRRDRVTLIEHGAYKVDIKRKSELLAHLIKKSKKRQVLVFANTKESVDKVYEALKQFGIKVGAIHADIEYKNRVDAIKKFRSSKLQVLVGTDVAARGIDIKDLSLVINYELPEATDEFTHRSGRTGRAGNHGKVISLLTTKDYNHFTKIERHLKLSIKREIEEGFELKDRQPRQKQFAKKKLSEKKRRDTNKSPKSSGAKSKKTTKRDAKRSF